MHRSHVKSIQRWFYDLVVDGHRYKGLQMVPAPLCGTGIKGDVTVAPAKEAKRHHRFWWDTVLTCAGAGERLTTSLCWEFWLFLYPDKCRAFQNVMRTPWKGKKGTWAPLSYESQSRGAVFSKGFTGFLVLSQRNLYTIVSMAVSIEPS